MKLFVQITGFVAFLALAVFAIIFYKERAVTFDMAYQDYALILTKKFVINLRVGALIPQFVPLICRLLNCPLRYLLMVISVNFIVFYFILFFVIAFILRHNAAALVFILNLLLLVNDTFYWIQSELPQGLAWLILYYAYIEKKGPVDIRRRPVLHFILILLLQSFHPLMVFPILFVLLFSIYKHYKWDLSIYALPLAIAILNFCIRLWVGHFDEYESTRLNLGTMHAPFLNFHFHFILIAFSGVLLIYFLLKKGWLNIVLVIAVSAVSLTFVIVANHLAVYDPSVWKVIHYAASDYSGYWLIFILTALMLVIKRKAYLTWMLILFTTGYLALVCLTNRFADKFYLENLLLPLGVFVLLPFVSLVKEGSLGFRRPALLLLAGIMLSRFFFIYQVHHLYTTRLEWYEKKFNEMDRLHTQRMMLTEKKVPMDTVVISWASGYESLILSSIKGPQYSKSLLIDVDLEQYRHNLGADSIIQVKYGGWYDKDLPSRYFIMQRGRYVVRD